MNCDDIKEAIALYCDNGLSDDDRRRCDQHLETCPVCRAHVDEMRGLRVRLATMERANPPAGLSSEIQFAVRAEAVVQRARRNAPKSELIVDWIGVWLQPRLARYAFSSIASLILFSAVFLALRPQMIALHEAAEAYSNFISSETPTGGYDINQPISPSNYAALRSPYNSESPSLDPKGGIATLNMPDSQNRRSESHDEMVVVADVYSNGVASLADVMHAPRDKQMLADFQEALRNNPVFVPASLDRRPETMRVVFSIQRVEVRESDGGLR